MSTYRSVKSNAVSTAVFTRDAQAWSQQAELLSPSGSCQDRLNRNADFYADIFVVSEPNDRHRGFYVDAAYIYVQNGDTSSLRQKLTGVEDVEKVKGWYCNPSCCGSSRSAIANRCRPNPKRRSS